MDPYSSPYIIPDNSLHNPFSHSLLSTRQFRVGGFWIFGLRVGASNGVYGLGLSAVPKFKSKTLVQGSEQVLAVFPFRVCMTILNHNV